MSNNTIACSNTNTEILLDKIDFDLLKRENVKLLECFDPNNNNLFLIKAKSPKMVKYIDLYEYLFEALDNKKIERINNNHFRSILVLDYRMDNLVNVSRRRHISSVELRYDNDVDLIYKKIVLLSEKVGLSEEEIVTSLANKANNETNKKISTEISKRQKIVEEHNNKIKELSKLLK